MSQLDLLWIGLANSFAPLNLSMTLLGLIVGVVADRKSTRLNSSHRT